MNELGVDCLTLWAASLDNLTKRPAEEIKFLDKIFAERFLSLSKNRAIHQHQIRVRVLGFWKSFLSKEAQESIKEAMETTALYSKGMLNLLIAYSGVEEMLQAVQGIVDEARRDISFVPTRKKIKEKLLTKDLPPVDLVIRTGGEPHLSAGFMMWDTADAQLIFLEKLWPDFTFDDFKQAIADFNGRVRRFGA